MNDIQQKVDNKEHYYYYHALNLSKMNTNMIKPPLSISFVQYCCEVFSSPHWITNHQITDLSNDPIY